MSPLSNNITEVEKINDQMISTDLLISAKAGVKEYARALTEAATPEVRSVLKKHLNEAISFHEQVSNHMMDKGYYHAYNINEQMQLDIQVAQSIMDLAD